MPHGEVVWPREHGQLYEAHPVGLECPLVPKAMTDLDLGVVGIGERVGFLLHGNLASDKSASGAHLV